MSPAPDNRTALAVVAVGSALAVMVAVQAPALIPALSLGLLTWGALYLFLRL
ncbi:hypothetical protein OHS70_38530 (plasmid) [Streptomyces sp. NBC_00390]|uniref:hypothetical protein n=1 Tax=Streptomyces sp. NBC_00390 TaxID=2975736 RepID=UPI002E1B44E1